MKTQTYIAIEPRETFPDVITRAHIADLYDVSMATVSNYIRGIEQEVQAGRYGPHSIIRTGGMTAVNRLVLIDYLTYRKRLADKNARKYVPPFDAWQVRKEYGLEEGREAI